MAHFLPVFLALMLNWSGINIFVTPKRLACLPPLPYLIFSLSLFLLIWGVHLRPSSYRGFYRVVEYVIELLISLFLIETLMAHFWQPLEIKFITFLHEIPDMVSKTLKIVGLSCTGACQFVYLLKKSEIIKAANCAFSVFFLISALHATRVLHFMSLMKLTIPVGLYVMYDVVKI